MNGVDAEVSAENATRGAVGIVVETDAVQAVVVLLRPGAGDGQLLAETAIATVCAHCESRLRLDCIDSRLQGCQVRPTPTVERQFADGGRIHNCADIGAGELHGRSFRGYLDDNFCRRSYLQRQINNLLRSQGKGNPLSARSRAVRCTKSQFIPREPRRL